MYVGVFMPGRTAHYNKQQADLWTYRQKANTSYSYNANYSKYLTIVLLQFSDSCIYTKANN